MTISALGGRWFDGLRCGLFDRELYGKPSRPNSNFASRSVTKTMKYSIYTDFHDINEDNRTIVDNGGCWWMNSLCGLFYRSLDSDARFVIHEIASRLSIRMACYFTHTDGHDIDEDIRSISGHGGSWPHGPGDGMFCRFLQVPPSMPVNDIASRLSTKSDILIHTDKHDIDEDIMTISALGGRWLGTLQCGPFLRHLINAPSLSSDKFASRLKKYQPLFSRD